MSTTGKLTTRGFDEYLERIVQAGRDVDAAAAKALAAGAAVALEGMQQRVAVVTGNLKDNLVATESQQDGNYVFVKVGLISADPDTARYGNAQEFGTSSMPAHPYVRPALDEEKARIRAAIKQSLIEDGTV
jgi:HK97 gp10 family phage protein